jgi:ectoine hydroxylase-related dioxygenase (phytanoyl-CoA dioxygenase family)
MASPVINPPINQSSYPVTQEHKATLNRDGYIFLPAVATAEEIGVFRPAITSAVKQMNKENRELDKRDTYGKAFLQIMNIWRESDVVKEFSLSRKFAKIAADLLGVENVRIYHDQALFKEPGGGPTPWHQDQYYWPVDTTKTITLWMPLVDIDSSMGILTFAAGSHSDGLVKNVPISDESEMVLNDYISKKGYRIEVPPYMHAGDATFHFGYTLHKAPGNYSGKMREVMTVIYYADGARITTPVNDAQELDRKTWFQGMQAGEPAASAINPLLL